VKEIPILFNGEMVRGILDLSKIHTRRPKKPQPQSVQGNEIVPFNGSAETLQEKLKSPFGKPGDRLWVRETFSDYWMKEDTNDPRLQTIHYRASWDGSLADDPPWTPSIHMPRYASRIMLEVRRVWVERVQDISEEDAKAEGVKPVKQAGSFGHITAFNSLWWDIYGYDPVKCWDKNPWVDCCEFEMVTERDKSN